MKNAFKPHHSVTESKVTLTIMANNLGVKKAFFLEQYYT